MTYFADTRGVVESWSGLMMRTVVFKADSTESVFDKDDMPATGRSGRLSGKLRQKLIGYRYVSADTKYFSRPQC